MEKQSTSITWMSQLKLTEILHLAEIWDLGFQIFMAVVVHVMAVNMK